MTRTASFVALVLSVPMSMAALALASPAGAQPPGQNAPTVRPAIDGILSAFEQHPLVGIGDIHNMAQQEDFFVTLIRDPRFAKEVGNVVVEFGTATHQDTLDRYINGGAVSFAELRSVWGDVVGATPTVTGLGYANFFVQVRTVNLSLPPEQRIRVWLGEPLIDWASVRTQEDIRGAMEQRDSYPAALIKREILAKGRKAVVIYGNVHFGMPGIPAELGPVSFLRDIVEQEYPGAFFVVMTYWGFVQKDCSAAFERTHQDWPIPALACPLRGTTIEGALRTTGCAVSPPLEVSFTLPNKTDAELAELRTRVALAQQEMSSGVNRDAMLYLGPVGMLTRTPQEPSIYMDAAYRAEINRRHQIRGLPPLPDAIPFDNIASPRSMRP
ncbi:MAG: hypothetical protein AB7Q29_12040 [Vicinamibacterales bacterium]